MQKRKEKTEHTQISVRLPNELLEQMNKRAKFECRTRTNMIEWLLREAMKGKK